MLGRIILLEGPYTSKVCACAEKGSYIPSFWPVYHRDTWTLKPRAPGMGCQSGTIMYHLQDRGLYCMYIKPNPNREKILQTPLQAGRRGQWLKLGAYTFEAKNLGHLMRVPLGILGGTLKEPFRGYNSRP